MIRINRFHALLIATIGGLVFGVSIYPEAESVITSTHIKESIKNSSGSVVKIYGESMPGSGVIIKKEGSVYTVVTAKHVLGLGSASSPRIAIQTIDGSEYEALDIDTSPWLDLALIRFKSSQLLKVASIAKDKAETDDLIAVIGYPIADEKISSVLSNVHFRGSSHLSRDGGYILAYSAGNSDNFSKRLDFPRKTLPGMSGGGVFDLNSSLIGIHGQVDITKMETEVADDKNYSLTNDRQYMGNGIPLQFLTEWRRTLHKLTQDIYRLRFHGSSSQQSIDDLVLNANKLVSNGDITEALKLYEELARMQPGEGAWSANKAKLHEDLGQNEQAEQAFDQAVRQSPEHHIILSERGRFKAGLGRHDEAIQDFNKALAIKPSHLMSAIRKMKSLADTGRCKESLSIGERMLPHYKSNNSNYSAGLALEVARAHYCDKNKKIGDADKALAKAFLFKKEYPSYRYFPMLASNILFQEKRYKESHDVLIQSLPKFMNAPDYLIMTARSALNFGDPHLAVSLSSKFASAHPESYELRSLNCYSLYKAKRYKESLKSCDIAVKLNPSNHRAYRYQGLAYTGLGNISMAERIYSLAIQNQGEDIDYMNRGEARWWLNNKKAACIDYKKAMSTSRKSFDVKPLEEGFDNEFIRECRKS